MILAIEPGDRRIPAWQIGSIEWPRRWVKINVCAGTTSDDFNAFIQHVMDDLDNNPIPGIQAEGRVFCGTI